MAATLLDYKASEPSNVQGAGVLPGGVTIPATITTATTGTDLADLGIFLTSGPPNRVELTATVGVEATGPQPRLAFIILRDNAQIFATEQGLEDTGEVDFWTVTFETVDFNVPAGFHVYDLRVVNLTADTALVVGPVVFSGPAYSVS